MSATFYTACTVTRLNDDEDPFCVMLDDFADEDGLTVEVGDEVELELADLHPNSHEALRTAEPDDEISVMIRDHWLSERGYL